MTALDAIEKRAREAKDRADGATPGPWTAINGIVRKTGERLIFWDDDGRLADYPFIASARTDVPLLAADVLALVDRLRKAEAVCEYISGCYVGHKGHHLLEEWRAKREAP